MGTCPGRSITAPLYLVSLLIFLGGYYIKFTYLVFIANAVGALALDSYTHNISRRVKQGLIELLKLYVSYTLGKQVYSYYRNKVFIVNNLP